jgi:hypothetical protein
VEQLKVIWMADALVFSFSNVVFCCFAVGSPLLNGKIRVLRRGIAPFAAPPTAFWISFASNVSPVEHRKVLVFFVCDVFAFGDSVCNSLFDLRLGFCWQFMV